MRKKYLLILLCLILILGVIGCSSNSSSTNTVSFSKMSFNDQQSYLWGMAESAVKSKLKAPSTAKFPSYNDFIVRKEGDNIFTVSAYVDAENGFGAMIRNDFSVKIEVDDDYNTEHKGYGYTIKDVKIFD